MKLNSLLLYFIFGFFLNTVIAQNAQLANSYFRNGEYEKAIGLYKSLYEKNPVRQDYFKRLIESYQQLENYEKAKEVIEDKLAKFPNQSYALIELGYNYQLQKEREKAEAYYKQALKIVENNPNAVYFIGQTFRKNHLLNYALESYKIAKKINPKLNTEISEAQIYGEQGEIELMFDSYLNLVNKNDKYFPTIQRYISVFITDDQENKNNILFKILLLKQSQNNPKDIWNILLSWLFLQQKEYNKAFIQEKAIFARNSDSLDRIVELAKLSYDNNDFETAIESFQFIFNNTSDQSLHLLSQIYLLKIDINKASTKDQLNQIDKKFKELLSEYGVFNTTLDLQTEYAHFLSFSYNNPKKAITVLESTIPLANTKFEKGKIQLQLADILVYTNQFNQALILYSQIQTELKNSVLAQEARFKVAQTSYFKGDFSWAQTQLKVLKSSTSQLISNDALELNLLISNNIAKDSIQDALKIYAKADLLAFQNKNRQAIDTLNLILVNFKGHEVEDDALFKQAHLYIKTKDYLHAEANYLKIIQTFPESILLDDSYFQLANLYEIYLNESEKAKEMYQKIIFNFPSSIYLVDARKKFRKLRGDDIQ